MLKQQYRLKRKSDIQTLFNKGKSVASPFLVLYSYKRPQGGTTRLAFAVSRKVGKAVTRNRIKRLMREGVRPHLSSLKEGYDIIFVAREKIKRISFVDVEKNITDLLTRAQLFK